MGTFNMLEAARANDVEKVVYCSTNKFYCGNVNTIDVIEKEKRYVFKDKFKNGIPESFSTDICEHIPYCCSKLTGDIYCQDYGHLLWGANRCIQDELHIRPGDASHATQYTRSVHIPENLQVCGSRSWFVGNSVEK